MQIFYDPNDNNEVKYFYTHQTKSAERFVAQGLVQVDMSDTGIVAANLTRWCNNCRIILDAFGNIVVAIGPSRPLPEPVLEQGV